MADPRNVYYLTGFWGEAFVALTSEEATLVVPALEHQRASEAAVQSDVVASERGAAMYETVKERLGGRKVLTDDMEASSFCRFSKMLDGRVEVDPEVLLQPRRVKDDWELSQLMEGGRVMDHLYRVTAEVLSPGKSEREVAAYVLAEMVRSKADPPAYPSTLNPLIVASGPNGALPHAYTTEKKVDRGEFVVCDYTLRFGGYVVDATRTFAVGPVSDEMKRSYDAVLGAQLAGISVAKAGIKASDVDKACRDHLAEFGLADRFVHGTGHGVGLDVHEPPWVSKGSEEVLQKDNTVTIEPGVYIPGRYGVRIEDTVVVKDKAEPLTHYAKELVSI